MERLAMVGLGRMGMNMALRLLAAGYTVVGYNRSPGRTAELAGAGGVAAAALEDLADLLPVPRVVWLMLPAGAPVDEALDRLVPVLDVGDIVVDGGNSFFGDDQRRADALAEHGIHYLDVGVSGGIWGREKGYCLMVGGNPEISGMLEPVFTALAPPEGFLYCGPVGAGHFVKMVHNGIEYGMMQAYAEGFSLIEASPYGKELDFQRLAHLWNQGSVVRSWLLELLEDAFAKSPRLADLAPWVDDSGEGRWTVEQAVELGVPAPVITQALFARFASRGGADFGSRLLAALRREFGGHPVKKA